MLYNAPEGNAVSYKFIMCVCDHISLSVCSGGLFLYNSVNTSSPGINSVTGIAADCVDNVAIYGVCDAVGTISANVPRLLCNETGYECKFLIVN